MSKKLKKKSCGPDGKSFSMEELCDFSQMHTAHQLLVIQRASLPIIVKAADGSTFEVTAEAGDLKENEYFWVALGLKVNRWQGEELKEEHFGAITKEQLSLLKTGSAILPGLVGCGTGGSVMIRTKGLRSTSRSTRDT